MIFKFEESKWSRADELKSRMMSQQNFISSIEIPLKEVDNGPEEDGTYVGKVWDIPNFAGELWNWFFSEEEIWNLQNWKILGSSKWNPTQNTESSPVGEIITDSKFFYNDPLNS